MLLFSILVQLFFGLAIQSECTLGSCSLCDTDRFYNYKWCKECYNSTFVADSENRQKGGCHGKSSIQNCEIMHYNSEFERVDCLRCFQGYYASTKGRVCKQMPPEFSNCYFATPDETDRIIKCSVCREGYFFDGEKVNCIVDALGNLDDPNCILQAAPISSTTKTTCFRCKKGFAIDVKSGSCVEYNSVQLPGCLKVDSDKRVCVACNYFDGWYSIGVEPKYWEETTKTENGMKTPSVNKKSQTSQRCSQDREGSFGYIIRAYHVLLTLTGLIMYLNQ